MKFRCVSGKHFFNSEEKADNCPTCRRSTDLAVKRHFKRQSDQMLEGLRGELIDGSGDRTHLPELKDPVWKRN